jgi:FkbM family methyltransferase
MSRRSEFRIDFMMGTMKVDLVKFRVGGRDSEFYVRENSSDAVIIGQIFINQVLNISKLKRCSDLKDFLQAGRATGKRPLIIDGGANIGAASVYFSTQCQDALVVAIEPEASNFQLLVENTKGMPVLPLPCALAATPQRVQVVDVGNGSLGFQTRPVTDEEASEDDVGCVTINEIFTAHQEDCFPFIVKIDIEGAEYELFQQHTEWIGKTPLIIIELHDWMLPGQGVALPFLRSISQFDRDFICAGENIFSIASDLDMLGPLRNVRHSACGREPVTESKT